MLPLYNLFVRLYYSGIRLASLRNKKAGKWIAGRKNVFATLEANIAPSDRVIWMHCSSAGEFEQGKPVIEALKNEYPTHKVVVSFFSPSGYEVAGKYPHADVITYLPLDTRSNAKQFIKILHPELVIFVKYEFWYHHLAEAAFHHIPILLISATFREDQLFFKKYGRFFRQILFLFRHIFVQDKASLDILQKNGIAHASISGDTRFDRVKELTSQTQEIDFIREFIGEQKVIVAGSSWEDDEKLLADFTRHTPDVKLILAPHEINASHLQAIDVVFGKTVRYSSLQQDNSPDFVEEQVLVIDSVGLLSRLYQYATIAYVGGGFTKDGIHNTLEAAVWEKPVVFGPNYKKYREAKELIEVGGGFSIADEGALKKLADHLFADEQALQAASKNAGNYVVANTGATDKILQWLQEKRLLTKL
ncbi:MAG TPA: glycosyltransferase N-terminal domain-containing protein [Flavisolibacter sp.]|nr:glycosyltransferase N-terminal domain-containing protein [Flavisolibacter sp.]